MRPVVAIGTTLLVLVVATAPQWWPGDSAGSGSAGRAQTGSGHGTPGPVEAMPARRTGSVRREPPRSIRLPSGVSVRVRAVSTRPDGLLGVPGDITRAGWWRGGSAVGDPLGSTLIAAHVDSTTQGLGPFAVLLGVRPGQRVVLASATLRQTFRVTSLRLLPKGSLVRHRWVYTASGLRRLVLATCAPPYVRDRGGYQNLAVVTAVPVSAPTLRSG
jgi:hypothetical protein